MSNFIAVTDGLVRIISPDPYARAEIMICDNRTLAWIAYETDCRWAANGGALVRCEFPEQVRSGGYARRALHLLLHHLATRTDVRTAVLSPELADDGLLDVAVAAGFAVRNAVDGERVLTRPVPPVSYTDGAVTIRPLHADDIDRHMAAIDDDQIDRLWEPGDRQKWEAMTAGQQREHNLHYLRACQDGFGAGPKWAFAADLADASYVAYVDCDLANTIVPAGEANISYTADPAYRGQGNVSRAVRLLTNFLRDHTGAGSAHIVVDATNAPSLRVARAVGATETERWKDEYGRLMIRHVMPLR
jgi:RimJ/RimL family protein N-acetyltransferase